MGEVPAVRFVERLFPSDLLSEFNLARGGMTVSQATDFNAPPADLLIYGECTPQKDQDFNNPGLLLDCVITVTSPTNLLASRSATVTCRSNEIAPLIEKSKALLLESIGLAWDSLAKGTQRSFSTREFELFKKQAFRLLPQPPREENGYGGWKQVGAREELERALRMLECAQLFTGSDTAVLVCTSAVLLELAGIKANNEPVKNALLNASIELANRAYRIESNVNTRGYYANLNLENRWRALEMPDIALAAARHIWSTRDEEPWSSGTVDAAYIKLIELESNWETKEKLLFDFVPMYEKRQGGLRAVMWAIQPWFFSYSMAVGDENNFAKRASLAKRLTQTDDLFLQALGHLAAIDLAAKQYTVQPELKFAQIFLEHYRAGAALIPQLETLYPSLKLYTPKNLRIRTSPPSSMSLCSSKRKC